MRIFLIILVLFFLTSCKTTTNNNLPEPDVVQMVPKSADTASVENGIDAYPLSDGILVHWYLLPNTDKSITEYNIHRRPESESFFSIVSTIQNISTFDTAMTYLDENVEKNQFYYYYVTAVNRDNKKSPRPDSTVYYRLLHKPLLSQANNIFEGQFPVLEWTFMGEVPPDQFILRIELDALPKVHYIGKFQNLTYVQLQRLDLNEISGIPAFSPGVYKWRIDEVGADDFSGSESNWSTFNVLQN